MKRNFNALIIIFVIAIWGNLSFGTTFKEYLDKGDESYKELKNLEAMNYYEDAYKLEPDNFNVMLRLVRSYNDVGEEYYEQRKRDEAEVYITKAVDFAIKFKNKFPDSAEVYGYLGMSYGQLALFRGGKEKVKYANLVEDNCKKAIAMNGTNFLPYVILGVYYRELASLNWIERAFANTFFGNVPKGSYEESETYLKKALGIDPNLVIAVYNLSKTYKEMGRTNDELALLKKVEEMPVRNFRDIYAKQKAKRRLSQM